MSLLFMVAWFRIRGRQVNTVGFIVHSFITLTLSEILSGFLPGYKALVLTTLFPPFGNTHTTERSHTLHRDLPLWKN